MPKNNVPRRRERLLISKLTRDLTMLWRQATVSAGFPKERISFLAGLYTASLEGHGITINKLALVSGIPRSTVERKLLAHLNTGIVVRKGNQFILSDEAIKVASGDLLDQAIERITGTARHLNVPQNGQPSP